MADTHALESGEAKKKRPTAIIAAVCAAVLLVLGGVLYAAGVIGSKEEDKGLQYATEGVVLTEDTGIHDELMDEGAIALEFRNDAYSADGQIFKCYVGNSSINKYDMFLAIYADQEMTDLICTTGMIQPGNAFETLTLDRALEPGDHMVYVAYTQMEDPKTIHAQTLHTMDFHVKEES